MTKDELHKFLIKVASKSVAKKRKVSAAIVMISDSDDGLDYNILSSGFNHHIDGKEHPCEDSKGVTYDEVIHAEVACLNSFNKHWQGSMANELKTKMFSFKDLEGYKMFVTHEPCNGCKAALSAAGLEYEVVGEFMKFDSDKPRMALVPASLSQAAARALSYGAKKYKVDNWRKTPDIESYISALQRHFDSWREGEDIDESGLNHLDHIAANLAFLIELKDLPKLRKDTK